MNYFDIANIIIEQATQHVPVKTKKKPNPSKRINNFDFSDAMEHEFWEMGFDDLAKMQDEDDIGYQVARHSH